VRLISEVVEGRHKAYVLGWVEQGLLVNLASTSMAKVLGMSDCLMVGMRLVWEEVEEEDQLYGMNLVEQGPLVMSTGTVVAKAEAREAYLLYVDVGVEGVGADIDVADVEEVERKVVMAVELAAAGVQ
jgi:hypothetical protein